MSNDTICWRYSSLLRTSNAIGTRTRAKRRCQQSGGGLMKSGLSVNLKLEKTVLVKYGTAPKVKSVSCKFEIKGSKVHENKGYEYLEVYLDSQLNLHHQSYKLVKRNSNRIRLLARVRPSITPVAVEEIYKSMINPIFHYCYPIYVNLSATKSDKLNLLQDWAKRLIGSTSAKIVDWHASQKNRFVAIDVFKSFHQLGNLTPYKYNWINHSINTRGNKSLLCLPKVKTEMFRKSVHYQGATIFNKLPRELREETSIAVFKNKLRNYYRKT